MKTRIGTLQEALPIARLILQASKVSRLFYTDLSPGKSVLESLIEDVKRGDTKCSYKRCLVALEGNDVIGAANFYPSEEFLLTEEMERKFGPEKIKYIRPMFAIPLPHSLYLSALAVDPSKQGSGIGKILLDQLAVFGGKPNRNAISLHCWVGNSSAMEFYKRSSFSIIDLIDMGIHPLIPYDGHLALLYLPAPLLT